MHQLDRFFDQRVWSDCNQFLFGCHKGRDFQFSQEIMKLLNAEEGRVRRSCLPNIPVCHNSDQTTGFFHDSEMANSLVMDQRSGFIERGLWADCDRIPIYLFSHETFVLNFHNLSLLPPKIPKLYIIVKSLAR